MRKNIYSLITLLGLCVGFTTCKTPIVTQNDGSAVLSSATENDIPLSKIAFGSCAKQDLSQHIWRDIAAAKPDIWVWLGDNIYCTPNATVEKMQKNMRNN